MNIIRLDWDSDFFGYEIGCYSTTDSCIPLEKRLKASRFSINIYYVSK